MIFFLIFPTLFLFQNVFCQQQHLEDDMSIMVMAFGSKDDRYVDLENFSREVSLVDLRTNEYCQNLPSFPEEEFPFGLDAAVGGFVHGQIIFCGGRFFDSNKTIWGPTDKCFRYDEDSREWINFANLKEVNGDGLERYFLFSTLLPNGDLWIIETILNKKERSRQYLSEIVRDSRIPIPDGPEIPLREVTCAVNFNQTHTMLLGLKEPYDWQEFKAFMPNSTLRLSTFFYDFINKVWTEGAETVQYHSGSAACVNDGSGRVYIFGGSSLSSIEQDPNPYNVEVFEGQQWKVVESANYFGEEKKSLMSANGVPYGDSVFITGRVHDPKDFFFPVDLDHVWRFHTKTGSWEKAFKIKEGQGISYGTSFLVPRRFCQKSGFFSRLMKKISISSNHYFTQWIILAFGI